MQVAKSARRTLALLGVLVLLTACFASCGGRSTSDNAAGNAGTGGTGGSAGIGGSAGVGATGGTSCKTSAGVRLCGGDANCAWVAGDECPGGGCARPFDHDLGGDSVAGICYSDLGDKGSRACLECEDGEVCLERYENDLVCVPEEVCAKLWKLGARGVCRYSDLSAYDGRPLPRLSTCPHADPKTWTLLCGGACPTCKSDFPTPCSGRSPDHPQGFCSYDWKWCALSESGYDQPCDKELNCGVFHVGSKDANVAKQYGRCLAQDDCALMAQELPGGFDCYDADGKLVAGVGN
ncbi:MAG: hypothetical protein R3B13_07490 [Polyangiaceae bacterium]